MHFWVSAARVSFPGTAPGHLERSAARWPRKIGTNWFIPAFVNNRFGESGRRLDEGTMVCPFDLKKSRNDRRIWALVIFLNRKKVLSVDLFSRQLARPKRLTTYATRNSV